ncbi:MAG TPA: hypothetical protein VG323_19670 [Thermoanaerobaculia bacterium]|nr:hypothetical protein [Thermoanaerobaculia bacterium]
MTFAVLWTIGYVVWSLLYYRVLDPLLRRVVGAIVGTRVVWVYRKGSLYADPLSFTLPYSRWSWGAADGENARAKDAVVYMLCVVLVFIIAGLWPVAVLLAAFFSKWLNPLVALLPLFLIIPIYSIWWSGRYRVHGT